MSADKREPDFSSVELDDEKRVQQALEDAGGLPEDNPFTEIVEELREEGESFHDIAMTAYDLLDVVEEAAKVEELEFMPEWKVALRKPAPDTPSGYRYEYVQRMADTAAEVEQQAREHYGYDVEESETEQVGVGRYS